MPVDILAIVVVAVLGALLGGRHLALRLGGRDGFECALRAPDAPIAGLSARFRRGWARREGDRWRWMRLSVPGPSVVFTAAQVGVAEPRRASAGERTLWLPPRWAVFSVTRPDGVRLELATNPDRVRRVLGGA